MIATSLPARVAMTRAAGIASLLALTVLSLTATSAAAVAAVGQPRSPDRSGLPSTRWEALGPSGAGHMADLLYPSDSRLNAVPVVPRSPSPAGNSSPIDQSPEYAQIALGGLAGMTIAAAVAGTLRGRRRRRPVQEAALAAGGPDEMSRAAGLIGDRLVLHRRTDAAAHAYRAAVDVGHEYWSPIAQVALARLLSDQGDHKQAQVLMQAVVTSGHPRAVPVAQAGLLQLMTSSNGGKVADSTSDQHRWEALGDGVVAGMKSAMASNGVYRRGSTGAGVC